MARLIVLENPLDTHDVREESFSGRYIDWLEEHYPNGFPGAHATALNLAKLEVEDYDVMLGDQDTLVLVVAPGWIAAGASLTQILIQALVQIALAVIISYAVNALFGVDGGQPVSLDTVAKKENPTAGSVYSLTTPTNIARIGDVIPVAYGRNWIYPNQGMTPYSYFQDNENYICQIQCLGLGDYDIDNLKVGGSYAHELPGGVLDYWIYHPQDHGGKFGVIQDQTGVYENVYTSPEVSDQELLAGLAGGSHAACNVYNGCWPNGGCSYYGGAFGMIVFDFPQPYWSSLIDQGAQVFMAFDDGPNAGKVWGPIWLMGSQTELQPDREFLRFKYGYLEPRGQAFWDGSYHGIATLSLNADVLNTDDDIGGYIGPFVASPPCMFTEHIQVDINMPGGMFRSSELGGLDTWKISVEFTIESIDNSGNPTGNIYTQTWTERLNTNTPQRRTIDIYVPKNRYRVSARRTTPLSERGQDQTKAYWVGLKSILGPYCDSTDPVYAGTTLVVSRMKATQGISSQATNRVMVQATRKLDGVATRNPIDAFIDIYTSTHYGAGRPDSELNLTELASIRAEVPDCKFDGIYDQQTAVYDAMKLAGQLIRGVPVQRGGLVSMVRDKPHSVPVAGFNEDNIVDLTKSYVFRAADDPDGLEGEYIDPLDSTKQYTVYPDSASNPEPVVLWGCTSLARARCVLEQLWKQRVYRREMISFDSEADALAVYFGDPINVQHRILGPDPILYIATSITPKDDFTATVEAIRYDHRVFT